MSEWKIDAEFAKNFLVRYFPDLFRWGEQGEIRIANGIEALNMSAYGYAVIVDLEKKEVFRVGEMLTYHRAPLERIMGVTWQPYFGLPVLIQKYSDIFYAQDIPVIFTELPVDQNGVKEEIISISEKYGSNKYIVVWGDYLGESFWEYFSQLVLRKIGCITGNFGVISGPDLYAYYIQDFSREHSIEDYAWSMLLFQFAPILEDKKYSYHKYSDKSSSEVENFVEEFKKLGLETAMFVIEAESTDKRARTASKSSGIGQVSKYIDHYLYGMGFVAGPGVDERILESIKEARDYRGYPYSRIIQVESIGIISGLESGEIVLKLPEWAYSRAQNELKTTEGERNIGEIVKIYLEEKKILAREEIEIVK